VTVVIVISRAGTRSIKNFRLFESRTDLKTFPEILGTVMLLKAVLKQGVLAPELTITEQRQHVFLAHAQSFAARLDVLALVATIRELPVATHK